MWYSILQFTKQFHKFSLILIGLLFILYPTSDIYRTLINIKRVVIINCITYIETTIISIIYFIEEKQRVFNSHGTTTQHTIKGF